MEKEKRRIIVILLTLTIIFTLIGTTFSYLTWVSIDNTIVSFTTTRDFSCSADGGGDITSQDVTIIPSSCENLSHVIKREIKLTTNIYGMRAAYTDMWLNVNSIGSYLSESVNFMYAITTGSSSCSDGLITSGNFHGISSGDSVPLIVENQYIVTTTDTYYLWIWLDKEETKIPSNDISTREFDFSLGGSCSDVKTYK